MNVEVTHAVAADRPVLERLMELYQYDSSELPGWHLRHDGSFDYPWWDAYWTESARHAYLFQADGFPVGFALVRDHGHEREMAEFFVVRAARRKAVGVSAAHVIFAMWPGSWVVTQLRRNIAATHFWRRAIPADYVEQFRADGRVEHRFTIRDA